MNAPRPLGYALRAVADAAAAVGADAALAVAAYVLARSCHATSAPELARVLHVSERSARRHLATLRDALAAAKLQPEEVPSLLRAVAVSGVPSPDPAGAAPVNPDRGPPDRFDHGRTEPAGTGQPVTVSLPEDRKMKGELRSPEVSTGSEGIPPPSARVPPEAFAAAVRWIGEAARELPEAVRSKARRHACWIVGQEWRRNGGAWRTPAAVAVAVVREWWGTAGAELADRSERAAFHRGPRCPACRRPALAGGHGCYTPSCAHYWPKLAAAKP